MNLISNCIVEDLEPRINQKHLEEVASLKELNKMNRLPFNVILNRMYRSLSFAISSSSVNVQRIKLIISTRMKMNRFKLLINKIVFLTSRIQR